MTKKDPYESAKEENFEGIPRSQIPWHPIIDYEKCVSCGKCVDYCHMRVFDVEQKGGEKRTVVKNPDACVVFCRGCEDQCPANAITHPSEEKTQKIIEKLQKAKG
jgi:NAD-dependent dihydropyrimidine dehydrogenase PreA subunit